MHSMLQDMDSFADGKVCIAGSYALRMYLRARGVEVSWNSNDVDVFFLAGGKALRETLLLIADGFVETWMQGETQLKSNQEHRSGPYCTEPEVDETDSEAAAWPERESPQYF